MFENLIEILKANPRKIVYTEGTDARILESAARLKKDGFLTPVLVGEVEAVKAAAEKGGFDIDGLEIIDPKTYDKMDEMVETMVALRKGKMTPEECRANLLKSNYFGTMLVKMGVADALLGGATYSTADTVRPALQLVKTRKGANVDLVRNATAIAKEMAPELDLDGEMQFDAAVSPVVGQLKFPGSKVAGYANTFIFPEIQSGNIGYKIAQRLGGYAAFGPILQGLNAPINDLSRGCDAEEVYQMSIITAALV